LLVANSECDHRADRRVHVVDPRLEDTAREEPGQPTAREGAGATPSQVNPLVVRSPRMLHEPDESPDESIGPADDPRLALDDLGSIRVLELAPLLLDSGPHPAVALTKNSPKGIGYVD